MKFIAILCCLTIWSLAAVAQNTDDVLAIVNGKKITAADLDEQAGQVWLERRKIIQETRLELFAKKVSDNLLALEAAARKTTVEKLLASEVVSKIADPSDAQIKAIYDANQDRLGDKSLAEVRPQIVAFLRREPEQKAMENFVLTLKTKYKPVFGKDINSADLKPTDILATVGSQQISGRSFEEENKLELFEAEAKIYDLVGNNLDSLVFSELVAAEAAAEKSSPSDILAREITDKMKDFSDIERDELTLALKEKLYKKYDAKIMLAEPTPIVRQISVDDDPAQGSPTAPVTVVMFSDFQCPACSATHPVLKRAIAGYADKIRFVVRDYPLESIHENAFQAAQAANAANAQGKFFEYTELLYNNQNSLNEASLKELASRIGLDRKKFDADLDSGKYAAEVRKDMADGNSYDVNSTPTVFINGVMVRDLSLEGFKKAIERALKGSR